MNLHIHMPISATTTITTAAKTTPKLTSIPRTAALPWVLVNTAGVVAVAFTGLVPLRLGRVAGNVGLGEVGAAPIRLQPEEPQT